MFEILLLLAFVILVFIAYKLIGLEKTLGPIASEKTVYLSTTLNPLFSEQEIAFQRNLSQQWQKKVDLYFDQLQKTEKEEIHKHQNSGKDKSEFVACPRIKNLVLQNSIAITGRNATKAAAEQMIETNISILNGKPINETSDEFYSKRDGIPWNNLQLDAEAWSRKPKIREGFEKDFLSRSDYWQSSWEHILDDYNK